MNENHAKLLPSPEWAEYLHRDVLPKATAGVELGPELLELGPGPGAATAWLHPRVERLVAVEYEPDAAARLAGRFAGRNVEVVVGDATALGYPDGSFGTVATCTMLHHIPTRALQDKVLAEAFRVLRPGGAFLGSDSLPSDDLHRFHEDDVYNPVEPAAFLIRLQTVGFTSITVHVGHNLIFTARKKLTASVLLPAGQYGGMATLIGSCGTDPGIACRITWDITHSAGTTAAVEVYLAGPVGRALRIAFVIVLALLARAGARRLIKRITERAATTAIALPGTGGNGAGEPRREQRARALGSILLSAVSVLIFGIAALTVLGDLGINLAPLLASAGVLGVALGFGAQNLVRDYLAGILMLVEDHYGVGDMINVGKATGTVEAMTLLTTRVRDMNGVVWHIHNGTIERVGNESQGWSRAIIDYPVPYDSDLALIRLLMERASAGLWNEPRWRDLLLEEPEVWGAQELSGSEVTMRIVAKTAPLRQWEVAREIRIRVKTALDAASVPQAAQEAVEITAPIPPEGPSPKL